MRTLFMLGAILGCSAPKAQVPMPKKLFVKTVVDGDTVILSTDVRVRIAGIDAPEVSEPFGQEAKQSAKVFCEGREVWIVGTNQSEHLGRRVGDVVQTGDGAPSARRGRGLAAHQVQQGLAYVYLIPPAADDGARLIEMQAAARRARRGIWSNERYRGTFHIASLVADAPGDDETNLNGEHVRLVNLSDRAESLRGYSIANQRGERYTFPHVVLPPGFTLLLRSGSGEDRSAYELHWRRKHSAWSNEGDRGTLYDPSGQMVDQATFDPATEAER